MRKSRPFNLGRFRSCTLGDINTGGIALVCEKRNLRALDRVDLRVHHGEDSYFVRGVVGYRKEVDDAVQYGIIFVEVPGELDSIIRFALQGSHGDIVTPPKIE